MHGNVPNRGGVGCREVAKTAGPGSSPGPLSLALLRPYTGRHYSDQSPGRTGSLVCWAGVRAAYQMAGWMLSSTVRTDPSPSSTMIPARCGVDGRPGSHSLGFGLTWGMIGESGTLFDGSVYGDCAYIVSAW